MARVEFEGCGPRPTDFCRPHSTLSLCCLLPKDCDDNHPKNNDLWVAPWLCQAKGFRDPKKDNTNCGCQETWGSHRKPNTEEAVRSVCIYYEYKITPKSLICHINTSHSGGEQDTGAPKPKTKPRSNIPQTHKKLKTTSWLAWGYRLPVLSRIVEP